jgi:CDP-diacylglycerol--serine O-phosphatidyltransferase
MSLPENDKHVRATEAEESEKVRIYVLPNLLTAGNLACGFFALTWIFKYQQGGDFEPIRTALWLILAAFAFDFFDGRLARLARKESRFGREFDSLADIVSFGVAPAFLIYRIVLQEFEPGWVIAAIYLVCGGIRLAWFNVMSAQQRAVPDAQVRGLDAVSVGDHVWGGGWHPRGLICWRN